LKPFIKLIVVILLLGCEGDSKNSNIALSNFIKPEYSFKESLFNCKMAKDKTLNSVERFIPKFVDSYLEMEGGDAEELYFLFPVSEDNIETQFFNLLLKYDEVTDLDRFLLTLTSLSFDDIATCDNSKTVKNSFRLTKKVINNFPVISEVLHCEYKDGFSYATMKLVIEQFSDALVKNNSPVEIVYSEEDGSNINFQWTNIFSSLESRKDFVESWQALQISKEIQEFLLEQSTCQSSKTFRQYKVL
tara:strand:- start:19283 stop:20020 length:738 start_codon:yes stop_codon:yes gene_type:complete